MHSALKNRLPISVLILSALLFIFGAWRLGSGAITLRGQQASQTWKSTVEGQVDEWKFSQHFLDPLFHSKTSWSLDPTLRYTVNRKEYLTSRWCYGDSPFAHRFETEDAAEEYLRRHPSLHADKPQEIFYDEQNPTRAVVSRSCKTDAAAAAFTQGIGIISLAILLPIIAWVILLMSDKKKTKNT